jgi:predicted nucleic acid-binding protein
VKCPSKLRPTVVVDTGPLIALAKASLLDLLPALFGSIAIPGAVARELQLNSPREDAVTLNSFIEHNPAFRLYETVIVPSQLAACLDAGEAEAIALATELGAALLIDEKKGRSVAIRLEVPILGTGRLLLAAKKRGHLSQLKPVLDKLRRNGYRLADPLVAYLLAEAEECNR